MSGVIAQLSLIDPPTAAQVVPAEAGDASQWWRAERERWEWLRSVYEPLTYALDQAGLHAEVTELVSGEPWVEVGMPWGGTAGTATLDQLRGELTLVVALHDDAGEYCGAWDSGQLVRALSAPRRAARLLVPVLTALADQRPVVGFVWDGGRPPRAWQGAA